MNTVKFYQETGKYKKELVRIQTTISEIKTTLDGINRKLGDTEKCISDLENRKMKITQSEHQKEKNIWNENSLKDLSDNIKTTNIHITRDSEGEEKEEGWKFIWWNYGWKLLKPEEGNRYPGTGSTEGPKEDETNRPTPRHIIIKMAKVKDKENSKGSKRQSHIQGNTHKAISWFFCRNFAGQKEMAWYI